MADNVQVVYQANIDQLEKDLRKLEKANQNVAESAKKTGQVMESEHDKRRREIAEIRKDLAFQIKLRNDAWNPDTIKRLNKEISLTQDHLKRVVLGTKQVAKETERVDKRLKTFGSTLKKLGLTISVAFAVQKLTQFTKESIRLGAQMEGVQRAFDALDRPDLLKNLRSATRGTISDLDLMRQAVQASHFRVPLNQLATFFEFATKRAAQTGESVDVLVDSIVKGIGRKSIRVIDNLGISATELQEEVRKVGDFGEATANIIERELTKMGDVTDTTLQKVEKFNAGWANFRANFGRSFIDAVSDADSAIRKFGLNLGNFLNKILLSKDSEEALSRLDNAQLLVSRLDDEMRKFSTREEFTNKLALISELMSEVEGEGAFQTNTLRLLQEAYDEVTRELENYEQALIDAQEAQANQIRNLFAIDQEISNLTQELSEQNTTLERTTEITKRLLVLQEERLKLLGNISKAEKDREKAEADAARRIADLQVENIDDSLEREKAALELQRKREIEAVDQSLASDAQKAELKNLINETFFKKEIEIIEKFDDIKTQRAQDQADREIDIELRKQEALTAIVRSAGQITIGLVAAIGGAKATQSKEFALFEIAINQGVALSELIKDVQKVGVTPIEKAALLAAGTAQLLSSIGKARQIIQQAPDPETPTGFAEGEIDIQGGVPGKDSIPAMLMPRESVIKADSTKKYKDELLAANEGKLEQLIHFRYVMPAIEKVRRDEAAVQNWILNNGFDDTSILRQLRKPISIKNVDQLAGAISRRNKRMNHLMKPYVAT